MSLAISGGCRCEELHGLHYNDLHWMPDKLEVFIQHSKVDQAGKGFSFYVLNSVGNIINLYSIIKKYHDQLNDISHQNPPLFICVRNGRFIKQPVGINTLYSFPLKITNHLNIENKEEFSGHSFRRTFATILATRGLNAFEIMKAGRWASAETAKRYIDYSQLTRFKSAAALAFSSSLKPVQCLDNSNGSRCITNNTSDIYHVEDKKDIKESDDTIKCFPRKERNDVEVYYEANKDE
ncbi:hypothetical protein WA158_005855 [Blastocystis sp. Blastoise]